jgi:hypothetical protein
MSYSITINHEQKYITYAHSGPIERVEIGDVWRELLTTDEFTAKNYNLLSDYRGATFQFSVDDKPIIDEFLLSIKTVLNGKRNAVIVENPHETVISILFENEMSKKINFHVKTFSTEEAALKYVSKTL